MLSHGNASGGAQNHYRPRGSTSNDEESLAQSVVGGGSHLYLQHVQQPPFTHPTAFSTNPAAKSVSSLAIMPPKRNTSNSPSGGPSTKTIKTEQVRPEEFSSTVKKRLQNSSRTGQACDRCKVCLTFLYSRCILIGGAAQVATGSSATSNMN